MVTCLASQRCLMCSIDCERRPGRMYCDTENMTRLAASAAWTSRFSERRPPTVSLCLSVCSTAGETETRSSSASRRVHGCVDCCVFVTDICRCSFIPDSYQWRNCSGKRSTSFNCLTGFNSKNFHPHRLSRFAMVQQPQSHHCHRNSHSSSH